MVHDSDDVLPVAEGLGLLQKAPGKRVAVVSDGGGQATIASDRLAEAGLELAVLSDTTRRRLGEILFPQASLVNPVDVAGSTDANPALLATCMEIVAGMRTSMRCSWSACSAAKQHPLRRRPAGRRDAGAESMIELGRRSTKPLVIYSLYAPIKPPALRRLHEAACRFCLDRTRGERAQGAWRARHLPARCRGSGARSGGTADGRDRSPVCRGKERGAGSLRVQAKALLRAHGVQVAPRSSSMMRTNWPRWPASSAIRRW